MNWLVFLAILAVLVLLAFTRKLNILGWMIVSWIATYLFLSYGIDPPLPASIVGMFMGIVTLALLAFLSASSDYMTDAANWVVQFITSERYRIALTLTLIAIPLLVALKAYSDASKPPQPPISGRTIHPPSPPTINFRGKTIDIVNGENPNAALKDGDPEAYAEHMESGRRIYYQNCVYCHGDDMAGKGMFAHGLDPLPANFQDPTTIAMLRETFLFWRIAKGAPGLPPESTPWASAMPAWENFLTEEEIWDVISYMYEFTGHKPRAREELH